MWKTKGDGRLDVNIPEFIYSDTDLDYLITHYVNGRNAERNRDILRVKYFKGYSNYTIAEMFKMSDVQVGRIIRKWGNPLILKLYKSLMEEETIEYSKKDHADK